MEGYLNKALLFFKKNDYSACIAILEKGFINVPDMDWGTKAQAHKLLADAYTATNQNELAHQQYLWLTRNNRIVNIKIVEEARTFIAKYTIGM